MKNFTNNFKQFTSRLSARWLIMTLMLLVGTSSAWAYNQSAADLYFDNSEAKWSNCYVYIGHSTWTSCYPLTRVSGTQYLWKLAKADFNGGSAWNGATGWVLCYEKWWDNQGESIDKYTWHGAKNVTKKRTSAWSASYIYKTSGTVSVTSDGNTINAYNTTTVSNKNYTVTINTVTGGTLTVKDYDNNTVSNNASKIYLTVLKFSATPSAGYSLEEVQINDGSTTTTIAAADLASKTHTLTSAVTITPVWVSTCPTSVTPGTASITSSTPICSGGSASLELTGNTANTNIQWQKSTTSSSSGFADINNAKSATYQASNITGTTYFRAKVTIPASGSCDAVTDYSNAVTISLKPTPTKPAITLNPADGKIVAGESATLTVTEQNDVTFTLYKGGEATNQIGTSFRISEAGIYHVVGKNSCGVSSPDSDKKTITVCTPNATLLSATYNQQTDKIDLSGNLTETCGKTIYYGFLWKVKGDDWNTNNAISGTGNSYNSTSTNNTEFNQSWANAEDGTTYVFTAYALNTATNPDTWYYDETGIEVSKCITVATPNIDPVAICAGSTATLTLKNKQNDVTYTLEDGTPIFTDGTTHTVKPNSTTTYTITATSTNSCDADQKETATVTVTVNAMPSLSPSATVTSICEGETKTIRINTNATSIKWYKNETLIEGQTTNSLSISTAGTYKVVVSNASGCSKEMSFTVTNAFGSDITPTITGSASVQSGSTGINYSTANVDGATYEWELPTGWTFSGDKDGNQITVSVPDTDGDGTITVRITKNSCTKTATLNVAWMDGFTVYLRRPHAKNETTQYNYWFEKSTAAGKIPFPSFPSLSPKSCFHHSAIWVKEGS